jgi:hypothetical protein
VKLAPVTGRAFVCTCLQCRQRFVAGDRGAADTPTFSLVYADLDGAPFEAYYCALCAETLSGKTSPGLSDREGS